MRAGRNEYKWLKGARNKRDNNKNGIKGMKSIKKEYGR